MAVPLSTPPDIGALGGVVGRTGGGEGNSSPALGSLLSEVPRTVMAHLRMGGICAWEFATIDCDLAITDRLLFPGSKFTGTVASASDHSHLKFSGRIARLKLRLVTVIRYCPSGSSKNRSLPSTKIAETLC